MVMVMVMNDLLPPPLCNVNQPAHSEIQPFQNLTMKIHGQGHVCGQRSRSRLTLKIQRSRLWSRSNPLVTFEAWNSINMFAFCFVAIGPFLAEIKQIQYFTLKIKGQGHRDSPTVWCLCAFFAVLSQCYVPFSVFYLKFFEHPSFGQVAHEIYPSEWKVHSSEISITIMYCWYMFLMAVATDLTYVTILI